MDNRENTIVSIITYTKIELHVMLRKYYKLIK